MTDSLSLPGYVPPDLLAPILGHSRVDGHIDDAQLVADSRRDQDAYAALYQRYVTSVYRYMLVSVGNVQDAQDLTAQTFLAGFEGLDAFQGKGQFAAWLFGIARRKVVDYYRHSKQEVPYDSLEDTPHPDRQPDQLAEEHFDFDVLANAIHTLAPDRAEVVRLRIYAELSVMEISVAMGRSENAIRMLFSRALHDLKPLLNADRQEHLAR